MIRCPGIAWSAGWAGSASRERPSHGDVARAPLLISIIRARRPEALHRKDRRQRVPPGSGTGPRRPADKLKVATSLRRRGGDAPPRRSQDRQHPTAGRGRKRLEAAFTKVVTACSARRPKIRDRARHLRGACRSLRRVWSTHHAHRRRSPHNACAAPPVGRRRPHRDRPGEGRTRAAR